MRAPAGLIVAVAMLGCGESPPSRQAPPAVSPGPPPTLTAGERRALAREEARIQRHCVAVARSIVDPEAAPTPDEAARAFAAADRLVAAVRAKPRAEREPGQDLRLYLGDVIENLEGSNCDPRMLQHLEAALARIPAE
jgi:hypothetical protein